MYGVNGNLYSEMTYEYPSGRKVPATYYWFFDGEKLTFQLWGKDLNSSRKGSYNGKEYILTSKSATPSEVEEIEFPTGKFELDGSSFYALEFLEDGTWRGYDTSWVVCSGSGKYVTNGNLWTEMTHDYPTSPKVPATYYWTYDGKNLTFQLWGEDVNAYRKALFDGKTYTKAD
jgi:hypothetical protein